MSHVVFDNKPSGTVKLQGVPGYNHGKAVKDLQPGDVIMWNGGFTSNVVELKPTKSGKMIDVILTDNPNRYFPTYKDGKPYPRRMGANRLVAMA